MKKILLLPTVLLMCIIAFAQDQSRKEKKAEKKEKQNTIARLHEEDEIIFNKHHLFGIKLSTDGYGLSYEIGKFKSPRSATLIQFEFNEKKHPKEEKESVSIDGWGQLNQAIYAKVNNFYQFKVGMGYQYLIGGKGNKNGVAISAIGAGGLSLGLMKSYCVDVQRISDGESVSVTGKEYYDDLYRYLFLQDPDYTPLYSYPPYGSAGPFKGWDKVKFSPGAHAKLAMRFDYAKFNPAIAAIETGVNAEYYTTAIEQLYAPFVKEKHFFFSAYLTIMFGKRK